MSLSELGVAFRAKTLSPIDVAEWAIANHDLYGETLNAYKSWNPFQISLEATAADAAFRAGIDLGPLQGVPVSVKDMMGVLGYPVFAGCPRPLPDNWNEEGSVVRALRSQLGIVSGKSHTVQFAYGGLGANCHWGAPRNPWDSANHRSPGGSSSGAGVSLHECSALLALGTDTAGSVRIPASATGTAGMRPTWGRWRNDGIVPLVPSIDTPGPIARDIDDLAYAFVALDPAGQSDVRLFSNRLRAAEVAAIRVGICDWFFVDCDPGIAEAVEQAIGELTRAGLQVASAHLPNLDEVTAIFSDGGLHIGEFTSFIDNEMRQFRSDLDPIVAVRLKAFHACSASEHLNRARRLRIMSAKANDGFGKFDAIIGPTLPITPPILEKMTTPEAHLAANMRLVRNTNIPSLLGLCAITIPVGLDKEGIPVGLQVVARAGADETLLGIALAFERVLGNSRRRFGSPRIHEFRTLRTTAAH